MAWSTHRHVETAEDNELGTTLKVEQNSPIRIKEEQDRYRPPSASHKAERSATLQLN